MRSSDHIRVFGTRLSCQLHAWDRPCHFPTRTRVLNIMQCVVIFQTTCKMETLQVKDKCKVHLCHCCACVHGYVAWSNANQLLTTISCLKESVYIPLASQINSHASYVISPGVSKISVRLPTLRGTTLFGELVGMSPGNIRVTPSTSSPSGSLQTATIVELC